MMLRTRDPFEAICDHVESCIIGRRKDHQPYGVFLDRDGAYYAAPLWWIQERGFRVQRVWRARG